MNNLEVAEANTLRMKARIAVRGLGLSPDIKKAVVGAIDSVQLPLHKYFKVNKENTVKSFIRQVMTGIGNNVEEKIKGEVEKCLEKIL